MAQVWLQNIEHHKPDHSHPRHVPKHPDHEYVRKRQERYIKAIIDNDIDAQMKFYSPSAVVVEMSDGTAGAAAPYSQLRTIFQRSKEEFSNVQYSTNSIHGTKHFTTWEFDCTLSNLISPEGERVGEKDAKVHALSGVALIWWNEEDKVEEYHQYTVHRDVEAVKRESEQKKAATSS